MTSCVRPCYDRADNKRKRKNKRYAITKSIMAFPMSYQSAGRVLIWHSRSLLSNEKWASVIAKYKRFVIL